MTKRTLKMKTKNLRMNLQYKQLVEVFMDEEDCFSTISSRFLKGTDIMLYGTYLIENDAILHEKYGEQLDTDLPAMMEKIQTLFPNVTRLQVQSAWKEFSKVHWYCDDLQLPSAKILLGEFKDEVDIFKPQGLPEGVEMLAWGMKIVANKLKGKIIEIGMDATSLITHKNFIRQYQCQAS
ncbi:hypothetical protein BDQ17DRAFT_1330478 [Cyathus striatus]|nr:hypothetical protein BDQ17DRAFT_1330478 [Cyathus striatus]